MSITLSPVTILMADDDPDDRLLIKQAMEENGFPNVIEFVVDGEDLINYLTHQGKYAHKKTVRPGLILLDLNMPKMDGRQALRLIKSDPNLRSIPVLILTTSQEEEDIFQTYDLGVNSFITKPARFHELVEVIREIGKYWFNTVVLPKTKPKQRP